MDVTVHGPLRATTGSKTLSVPDVDEALTVRELLERLAAAHPRTRSLLFADDGAVQGSVRVLVDGETVEPDERCRPSASVEVVPAVRGGGPRSPDGSRRWEAGCGPAG